MIRDRIVCGIRDKKVSERLQLETELTLEKAINTARQAKTVKKQQEAFKNNSGNNIYALRKTTRRKNVFSKPEATDNSFTRNKTLNSCYWCGKLVKHTKFNCPARKAICNKCKKVGHYAKVCKAKVSINEIGEPNQSSFLGHVKGESNINNSVKRQLNQWNSNRIANMVAFPCMRR
ncbi:uncharacterized protein LOC111623921 [Centruroides sculpturatus]|uniref:uncharacterized protein LOC111623921 n=1 Tax=Centruroides sculpturatus TaxID=218467 RepID=UPI000C6D186B|nr:uncharacterized protein LOC111623921 [Centruroides sculpturatus]